MEEIQNGTLNEKLHYIQQNLNVPKANTNEFAKFDYRTLDDIFQNLKPLLSQTGTTITITDDLVGMNGYTYVKATAEISDGNDTIERSAFAREAFEKKGMDSAQMTGTASTYARKYACNGLLAIDDTKDVDSMDNRDEMHFDGTPVKPNMMTQDQSIILDKLMRDKLCPKDQKDKLVQLKESGWNIGANEAQVIIQDVKAGITNNKPLTDTIINKMVKEIEASKLDDDAQIKAVAYLQDKERTRGDLPAIQKRIEEANAV